MIGLDQSAAVRSARGCANRGSNVATLGAMLEKMLLPVLLSAQAPGIDRRFE